MKTLKTKPSNTWSALSNVTVSLKPSRDYQKILLLLYGLVVFVLYKAHVPEVFIIIFWAAASLYFWNLWCLKTPGASCVKITYADKAWQFYVSESEVIKFSAARIRYDFGWLMWLVFESPADQGKAKPYQKHLLVFYDQIKPDEHRWLRLVLRG